MKRKTSNATDRNLCSISPELQLEIVDENLRTASSNPIIANSATSAEMPAPSSSSSQIVHEHKETYVNMMYNNATVVSPGTIESPIEDDDDAEMMKSRTKKSSRTPFRFKQFSLMKSGSFKLKQMSPPPTELRSPSSPIDDKSSSLPSTFERQKSTTSSTRSSSSRLKKLFMLSRADPSRRRQKDISLRNLRHVL